MSRFASFIPLAAAVVAAGCGSPSADDSAQADAPAGPTGQIAYSCGEPPRVCVIDADGGGYARLTGDAVHDEAPDWTPDGDGLVTSRVEGDHVALYRLDIGTGAAERLTPPGLNATYGRVSPDGSRLVFVCLDAVGGFDLCVSDADGSGIEVLVGSPFEEFDADWSPDGTQIVFARASETAGLSAYVVNADGTGERRLGLGFTPAWSPDGRTIAVSARGIRLLDVESGELRPLTDDPADLEPSWSPDGRWIVFRRGEMPDGALFVIGADGKGERRLTSTAEPASLPSWSPAG